MSRLNSIRDSGTAIDTTTQIEVFHIKDQHALVQAVGYIKYIVAKEKRQHVFYRGQSKIYPELSPSLYRGIKTLGVRNNKTEALSSLVKNLHSTGKIFQGMHIESVEPLLQHYGIQTTWLDLVDNIWIALWFSCYRSMSSGSDGKYLNFEKRSERRESQNDRYAYIILVATDLLDAKVISPGIWRGKSTELVDLRLAAPSMFLRPHAQHGLLFRNLGKPGGRDSDYSSSIVGIFRVDLADALDWLGNGSLLDTHSLFPPASYDFGYGILLDLWSSLNTKSKNSMGTINYIGT